MPADSTIQRLASFAKNSKAHDDSFTDLNGRNSYILDVLKNDQGDQSKVLWSLDEGSGVWNEPADLLSRDDINSANSSQLGAQISITQDGKVAYVITPELQSKLRDLAIGESLDDTFIYAMKLGQGDSPLNWAKATVTLSGLNHAPELTGTTAILANGTQNTDYKILASDLLQGFTDADNDSLSIINLTATHGLLTETAGGWVLTPEESYASDIQLNYDVTDGHGGSVSATQQFTLEPSNSDNTPPSLISTEPFDDFDAYAVNNNIVLRFDETVAPGTGNIIVSNGTDTRIIAADDSSQVMFSGSKVTINPSSNLVPNTTYHVEMASGVITDLSGNPFAGIGNPPAGSTDLSTFNFTTSADTSAPQVIWSQPAEGQPFKIDGDITIGFNEEIAAGTGNIVISNGSDTRTIALNDASQVTIGKYFNTGAVNNGFITINPAEDLILDSTYRIEIISGAITDTSGNAWGGFSDILSFSTISSNPRLSWSNPLDESTDFQADNNIELFFDEAVKPGSSGNIIISNGTDTRTIAIHDANQVTFTDYGSVTVNPSADLIPGTYYHIKIDSGAITDLAGNPYAGISDETTINFSTISSEPWLYWSSPQDDSADFQVDHNIELYFNEGVQAGSNGNIVISNGSDIRTIAIHDTSQVTFTDYGSVVINPSADLISGTSYHIKVDSGAITDAAGNAYAGINDETTLNFSTISSTPLLYWSYPLDDSTDLQIDRNIELYFNETIQPGSSGNIVISNGSDTRTIAINDTSQVIFDGFGGVSINPSADLIPDTHYHIKIDNGAITDLDGNAYAGIGDDTTLDFSTITTEPLLSWSDPMDNTTAFQTDHDIKLFFNEEIQAGNGGNIVISNGSDTRTIAIHDSSQVTFSGSKVTINPTADLIPNTNYSIRIDNGTITDLAGNAYAGINDDVTLNFSTVTSEPRLTGSTPWDNSIDFQVDHNIELYFDEEIQAGSSGSGNIIISNGADTRTIAIHDASQVIFNGCMMTINPSADLIPFTHYSIQIDNGAITDLAGNAYAGINDNTTLDFSTVATEPQLSWSSPYDEKPDFPVDGDIELFFNEAVQAGSSGNIVISNGTDTRTIAVDDTSQVSFSGYNRVAINPLDDLIPYTSYSIRIDSAAITDLTGNTYAGISDDTTLNFSTVTTEPRLSWSNPWDDYTGFQIDQNIELFFNEWVHAGSTGNIIITNGSDTRTIAANDSSQVTFNGSKVTINPAMDLVPNTGYSILIDNGAITDEDGNAYAGINDDTALNFTTAADDGTLLVSPVIVGSPGLITPDIAGSHFPII